MLRLLYNGALDELLISSTLINVPILGIIARTKWLLDRFFEQRHHFYELEELILCLDQGSLVGTFILGPAYNKNYEIDKKTEKLAN